MTRAAFLGWLAAAALSAQTGFVQAKVERVDEVAPGVKRLRLRMPRGYRFEPGQFALIRLPAAFVRDWNRKYGTRHEEVVRPYSFALGARRLPVAELLVQLAAPPPNREVPPGIASTYIHHHLSRGDSLDVSHPMGSLAPVLEESPPRPLVLLAGGTGVAPFVGLLDHCFSSAPCKKRRIYLFFGARTKADLIFDARFRRWAARHRNFTYIPALSGPVAGSGWTGATGFINTVFEKHFAGKLDADVLIAGSPRMMQEASWSALAKGIPASQIRHDPIQVVGSTATSPAR